jgi:hypothetical protein
MTTLSYPARRANVALLLLLLALPACTVGPWQKEFWQPPAASGIVPIESGKSYPITRATGEGQGWPNLADVPAREPVPLGAAQADAALAELVADRANASQPALAATVTPEGIALVAPTPPPEIAGD